MKILINPAILCITFSFLVNSCIQTVDKEPDVTIPNEFYLENRSMFPAFKEAQLGFERVRIAYRDVKATVFEKLIKAGVSNGEFDLFLRVFKKEKIVELWVRPKSSDKFVILETYPFCNTSGAPGPKRRQGDLQIPEGFYRIEVFNPASNYFLSLGVNYPNASDKILGYQPDLGNDIYFHGGCATVGCVPITDDLIKEVYVLAVEARAGGQENIPVHFFPARMTENNLKRLKQKHREHVSFWDNLKPGYDYFEEQKMVHEVRVNDDGLFDY